MKKPDKRHIVPIAKQEHCAYSYTHASHNGAAK